MTQTLPVRWLLVLAFSVCINAGAFAQAVQSQPTKATATKLDEFLQGLQTLQADFRQTLRDGQGRLIEESQGVLAIHRPDRFRWDYVKPHEQTIVADGKKLWLHDVDLEQVTVRPMEHSLSGTPAVLLSGSEDLRSSFKVTGTESKGGTTTVNLVPKRDDTDFKRVRIKFVGKQLASMELSDKLGQSTTLDFTNVQRNASLDDARFVFTPGAPGLDGLFAVNDKVEHATGYAALTIWFAGMYSRSRYAWIAAALFAMGVMVEFLQGWMSLGRNSDPFDVLANTTGIAIGIVLSLTILSGWAQRIESVLFKRDP